MAEGGTRAEFERWVAPHLTSLARYAGRRVGPADRDDVVQRSLIHAYQRWSTYDASRDSPVAWLLRIVAQESGTHRSRQPAREVVELVDSTGARPETPDVDLERAVEGLGGRERRAVDLHYFVGLDVATVAEIERCAPGKVDATLQQSRHRLLRLLGDDPDHPIDEQLRATAVRWQGAQPPPPEVPIRRLHESLGWRLPRRRVVAAAAAVLLVGGVAALVGALSRDGGDSAPAAAATPPPARIDRSQKIVPFRDLEARHPALGDAVNGARVTPYDDVSATGDVSGTVHPGATLVFDVALESPGFLSLLPCPDYTITIGTQTTTHQLNCAEVPYFASLVRSTGKVSSFRPVLPAGTQVLFRMQVVVPDEPGRQRVGWTLDGPQQEPGFEGVVDVAPR